MSQTINTRTAQLKNDDNTAKQFNQRVVISGDSAIIVDPTVAAAKVGQLTTRTDANTGTLTMVTGHGITTAAKLDVYWTGGKRIGMTVGTVSGDSVPIDLGSGTDLPALNFDITAMVPQVEPFVVDNGMLLSLMAGCSERATLVIVDSGNSAIVQLDVDLDGAYIWDENDGAANPLTSDAANVWITHDDSTNARQVNLVAVLS